MSNVYFCCVYLNKINSSRRPNAEPHLPKASFPFPAYFQIFVVISFNGWHTIRVRAPPGPGKIQVVVNVCFEIGFSWSD